MRLSELTTMRLGGPAGALVEARSEDELIDAARGDDVLLVAGGSNLVIADEGWPGTVVRVCTRGIEERRAGVLTVAAGEEWEPFVARETRSQARPPEAVARDQSSQQQQPEGNLGGDDGGGDHSPYSTSVTIRL